MCVCVCVACSHCLRYWCTQTSCTHIHTRWIYSHTNAQNQLTSSVLQALINQDSEKAFRDIERSKQWGEMALGFPWQLLQAAKRAALKTYVRLDWSVHSEPSNRFSVQPITLSRTALAVLTFDLLSVSGLEWFRQRKLLPLMKKLRRHLQALRLWEAGVLV